MANKPETALYRAPTFSFLLVSHGGLAIVCVYIYINTSSFLHYGMVYHTHLGIYKNTITRVSYAVLYKN